ncbi:hypothetical protein COX00_02370 [Candidatus Uhrbacteria bacterium CG22_combo_CG10-13_8_21_14_all_47_17]|uniref:Uncharacterized protein n=1 Tax=Candidatus Uhrbacteria bacterium CG22_combo_CG10-13_8_21_14_all_47_17 TaxID=1975041 RepID=A0A2H0BSB0_9BACT|nr:MAG: hypothetical protein COX00_02370 [Candidatus Uhrbacteria bacterium CG22_combo_CG10-13_8_21_14_all_47_17]
MNQPDFLSTNAPQDTPQPAPKAPVAPQVASELESLKAMLQALEIPHKFDVEAMGLEEKDISAMAGLLRLDQNMQVSGFTWTPEDDTAYKEVNSNIHHILERFTTVPSDSNEGILTAFLRNKLAEVDLAATQIPR